MTLNRYAAGSNKMKYLLLVFLTFSLISAQSTGDVAALGRWINPPSPSQPSEDFARNAVWTIGETQLLQWTTVFRNYTIVLWQQAIRGGSANKGPAIFQTERGAVTQLNWIVQSFEFDLRVSNVFFLWLHDGPYADNGDTSRLSLTSPFFNLTQGDVSASSSSTQSTRRETASITSSTSSSPTNSGAGASSQPSTTNLSSTPASTSTNSAVTSPPKDTSGGLTTAARIGLGIGGAFACLLLALLGFLLYIYFRRRSKAELQQPGADELQDYTTQQPPGFVVHSVGLKRNPPQHKWDPVEVESAFDRPPAEMHGDHRRRTLAELG